MSETTSGVLPKMLASWTDRPETWKIPHETTLKDCDRFNRLLATGVEQFHLISKLDELWNPEVARGTVGYEQSDEEEILQYYLNWLGNAESVAEEPKGYLLAGYVFQIVPEFHRCLDVPRGVCTGDAEFFAGGDLTGIRDRAIDDNRSGETVEMHRSGD
jgi:hypothetical protein